ncbi:M6 family metalloprotease domain-containing protein [Agromyces protaetiae]|uniref:M6 family metalloprotease domain-containing protein n=1 Tax=Agromyces protaetiae TaxID=2509455 RepID=A0A4P6FFG6_9MICO|nr:immune inhibitor A domain-containing protein [Agromyces protaetiae]QAY72497.1 M6 family metalloprotease domain-containing protein [Agromyces protaetiae]
MSAPHVRARKRAAATVPVVALIAAGLVTVNVAPASAAPDPVAAPVIGDDEYYMNYVEPRVEQAFVDDVAAGDEAAAANRGAQQVTALEIAEGVERKFAQGNPVAAKELAHLESQSIKTGKSPKQLKRDWHRGHNGWGKGWGKPHHGNHWKPDYKEADETQEAKLLTILVEFDENAQDDFTGLQVPTEFGATTCMPGGVQSGPLHNGLPNPADLARDDNNSMWVPDFSSDYYNKLLFSDKGVTERVRKDLKGPDGKRGIDISGYTMKNMYEEMSRGAYTVHGEATPWITVPHSEAYYGATVCHENEDGVFEAGPMQDMQGHPDNPRGPGQLPIDAVAALAAAQPDFPWADYDIEDQGDRDGDGDLYEPDGVIDHVVLVHAGADKSGGGGDQGTYAIWAHSSAVPGGAPIPGTDLFVSNYIVQPEDSGVGVFAHEYGHDLGLPDLYDTSNAGNADVDFWDLMNSGSHSGPIFQSMPTHMGLWDKWVLGWADPLVVNPGDRRQDVTVSQNSRPLKGQEDGVKINLPDKDIVLATPHSGTGMWYNGTEQDWGDIRLARDLGDVPANAKFWMWNDYVIELDWDFGFVEVSTDGGATWTDQPVYNEDGSLATTPETYSDPNGNLRGSFGREHGLTGSTEGWAHQYIDLSSFGDAEDVQVRLRFASDAAFQERGWFADDFALVDGADQTVWSDDVEYAEGETGGWTNDVSSWAGTTGPGWRVDPGYAILAQYYLVEWRNYDGFDEGLKYGYDTVYQDEAGAWKVDKIAYNAPGALVWYRDTTYGNANMVRNNLTALPSAGAKGGLLIVDSHFDPLRRTGKAAAADTSALKNLPSRAQSSNAAFGLEKTADFKECFTVGTVYDKEYCTQFKGQKPVAKFTDDQGWVPGFEYRPDLLPTTGSDLYYRYVDGSVVVPSVGNAPYTTRIVDKDGRPVRDLFGTDIGITVLGTGNPADAGVGYGTSVEVKKTGKNNTSAVIRITPPKAG